MQISWHSTNDTHFKNSCNCVREQGLDMGAVHCAERFIVPILASVAGTLIGLSSFPLWTVPYPHPVHMYTLLHLLRQIFFYL